MRTDRYEYLTDENGNQYAINHETGEAFPVHNAPIIDGSIIFTPEQQAEYRERKERKHKSAMRRKASNEGGRFYFLPGQTDFNDLSPATAARLIFLATYTSYNDNRLMVSQRKPIVRKELPGLLKVSKTTADRFWTEVSPRYLREDEDGLLLTNSDIFIKGTIQKRQSYQKMFIDGIRHLYCSVPASKHKALGYVFQMLPFINYEWNVLCYNPDETDLDNIHFMRVDDFREAIGYDKSNISRLLKTYYDIKFPVDGNLEPFCAFVSYGASKAMDKIIINPRILYSGSNPEYVRILGGLCKD